VHGSSVTATGNSLVVRDSAGRIKASEPVSDDDVARLADITKINLANAPIPENESKALIGINGNFPGGLDDIPLIQGDDVQLNGNSRIYRFNGNVKLGSISPSNFHKFRCGDIYYFIGEGKIQIQWTTTMHREIDVTNGDILSLMFIRINSTGNWPIFYTINECISSMYASLGGVPVPKPGIPSGGSQT
jgi:hypothetical protein